MKNKGIYIIIVIAVLVVGVLTFYLLKDNEETNAGTTSETERDLYNRRMVEQQYLEYESGEME